MQEKSEFTLDKLRTRTQTQMSNLPKGTKGRKLNFWEFPDNGNGKKKKKRPKYYKRQLYRVKKDLI